ncbi:MAG: TetR/AcrR family transcriptional regulator [Anaerolineales bacterium]|nr:TetR/AcrR family transcriptional regulator [Anaerolineales bacterium]
MEQIDRRVRRTKKSLEEALIALALEKEYGEITIQEITDRADIGYRTFFRHYSDKDELLKEVLNSTMLELRELMAPPPLEYFIDPNIDAADLTDGAILFWHVQENSDLYRVLLFSDRTIIQPLEAFAIQEFKANYGSLLETDIPFDIIANHMVSAMITLLRWWLDNDMALSPEVMGEYSFRLIAQPIRETFLQALSK